MRRIKNIKMHELIGLKARIIESTNYYMLGLHGTIVDESKNIIVISNDEGLKKIPKSHNTLKLYLDRNTVTVLSGNDINNRPEERIR